MSFQLQDFNRFPSAINAIKLAIEDHKAFAKVCVDNKFLDQLTAAQELLQADYKAKFQEALAVLGQLQVTGVLDGHVNFRNTHARVAAKAYFEKSLQELPPFDRAAAFGSPEQSPADFLAEISNRRDAKDKLQALADIDGLAVVRDNRGLTYVFTCPISGRTVEFWYDAHIKSWVVQAKQGGNQIGDALFVHSRTEAERAAHARLKFVRLET